VKQRLQVHFRLTLRQRNHCPESGHGMPCPDISIATAAGHAVPRHLHRYSGGALPQSGAAAITMRSRHAASGCTGAPPR